MSASSNAIVAKFGLDLVPLRKAAAQAATIVKGMGSKIRTSLTTLTKAVAPLAAALGLAFSAAKVKSIFDMADNFGDLSAKVGISVASLIDLNDVMEDNGASVEMLGAAMTKMQSAFQNEKGVSALQQMGLNVQDLVRMQPEQAFKAIGSAIGNIENPVQRAAMAMAIFGKMGRSLIPTFRDPAFKGIAANTSAQAKAIAANAEMLGQASDAFNHMLRVGRGFFVGVAVKIAPMFLKVADAFSKIDLVEKGKAVGNYIATAATLFSKIASSLYTAGSSFVSTLTTFASSFIKYMTGVYTLLYQAGEGLVKAFGTAWNYVKDFYSFVVDPANTFSDILSFAGNALVTVFDQIVSAFKTLMPVAEFIGYTLYSILLETVQMFGVFLAKGIRLGVNLLGKGVEYAMELLRSVVSAIGDYFASVFPSQVGSVWQAALEISILIGKTILNGLITAAVSYKDIMLGLAGLFVTTIYDGLKAASAALIAAVKVAGNGLMKALSNIPGLGHLKPEKDTSFGEEFDAAKSSLSGGKIDSFMEGMRGSSMESIQKGLKPHIDAMQTVINKGKEIFDSVSGSVSSVWDTTKSTFKSAIDSVKSAFDTMETGDWANDEIKAANAKAKEALGKLMHIGTKALESMTKNAEEESKSKSQTSMTGASSWTPIGSNSIWNMARKRGVSFVRKAGESQAAYEERKERIRSGGKSESTKKQPAEVTNDILTEIKNTMQEAWT